MSFLEGLVDAAGTALNWYTGNSIGANIARTAVTGYALNKVQKSIIKDQKKEEARENKGTRIQIPPNTTASVPVIYGTAYTQGIITDARLVNSNKTMYYCITLCEQTGSLLSNGSRSDIYLDAIYWNDFQLVLQSDGNTASHLVDIDGNTSNTVNGLIKVWFFSGSSDRPINITGYSQGGSTPAYQIMPEWGSTHTMNDLAFVIIRMDYNSVNSVTNLGKFEFKIRNTMTMAGDVLYDYMTNTRYGGSIAPEEIYSA